MVDDLMDGSIGLNTDNIVSISLGINGWGLNGINYDFLEDTTTG